MKNLAIWVISVVSAVVMAAPVVADSVVRMNCDRQSSAVSQPNHLQFLVSSGRVDSIAVIGSSPTAADCETAPGVFADVMTYSGDEYHAVDFYQKTFAEFVAQQPEINKLWTIESRIAVGARELLTVNVGLGDNEAEANAVTVVFYGTDDLQVEQVIDVSQLRELARAESGTRLGKSVALSALEGGAPDYLIVTGGMLIDAFKPLLSWKATKGLTVGIVTMDQVLALSSGVDDAEKLRNFLIEMYNSGTRYVLLGGDETVVPIRYAFAANTTSMPTVDLLEICDLYFGDVNGNWDVDGDGVFGEPSQDNADLNAELLVGKLPVCTPEQVTIYVSKLIKYEQNPNSGNYAYLNRSLFVAADQMRDYGGVGQHELVAQTLPPRVISDVTDLVEAPTGIADNPPYPLANSSIAKLSEGWGILTLLIHGRYDGWVIRSNQYNLWPKSFVLTATGVEDTHGYLPNVVSNNMPGLVYSIGCNNGAFDMDTPPFPSANPCVATAFLTKPDGGAVAFVGYSRWGWVAASWRLEQAFLDYLYNTNNNPAEALRYSVLQFSHYRDLCYGLNLAGDPEMKIWTDAPQPLAVSAPAALPNGTSDFEVTVSSSGAPLADALVTLMKNDSIVTQLYTDSDGRVTMAIDFNSVDTFEVCAVKDGYAMGNERLNPRLVLGTDDDDAAVPTEFTLYQNYPNPFNPMTTVAFVIDRPTTVTLEIFNVLGEKVKTAICGQIMAGRHEVEWDGSNDTGVPVSSGVYFAKLRTNERSEIIMMCMLK